MIQRNKSPYMKAIELATLQQRTRNGEICKFAFQKSDGNIRVAIGTLEKNADKANVIGHGKHKRPCGIVPYLDLEKMSWRSFREDKFIGIIDC